MAAGFNIGADIAGYVKAIEQQADKVARDNNIVAALVTGFDDRQGTAVRNRSEYGTATINSISDTDDLQSQTFYPSVQNTLTPGEFGAQFFLTDTRIENDLFNVQAEAAQELGMAMAQKIELDLLSTFSSLNGGTVSSSGNMTWGIFLAGLARLRAQNAPGPYYAVLHPYQWHSMGTAVAPGVAVSQTNAPDLQNELLQNYWMGNVYGVNIFTTANLASGTAVTAGIFARPAIALDLRRHPRIEPERDASRRGYELNLSGVYAKGVWRPAFGVQMISAGTAPTA